MAKVEVKFTAFSSAHNAAPGDVKKVEDFEVARLESDGVAAPTSKTEAEKAK